MSVKKLPVFTIILFVLSGLLILYSIWAIIQCHGYIAEAVAAGQLIVSGNEYDVVNFYMSSSAQYVLFAVILAALGWMFTRFAPMAAPDVRPESVQSRQTDEELDDWFEEMKSVNDNIPSDNP